MISSLRVHKIRKTLDAKILGRSWGKVLAMGVLMMICGILCIIYPYILMIAIGIFVGISIISSGINLLTFAFAKAE